MSSLSDTFNRSPLSHFLNRPAGRVFRIVAGLAFLVVGILYYETTLGLIALGWSFFPLSAGGFDVCYISVALGGPFSGATIRRLYKTD